MDHSDRLVRLLAWLLVGLMLGGYIVAHAETTTPIQVSATVRWSAATTWSSGAGFGGYSYFDTYTQACVAVTTARGGAGVGTNTSTNNSISVQPGGSMGCNSSYWGNGWASVSYQPTCSNGGTPANANPNTTCGLGCPSGQNWTYSGGQCTRPDCVAGQIRNPSTGICEQNCAADGAPGPASGTSLGGTGSIPSTLCVTGCAYYGGSVCAGTGSVWACDVGRSAGRACTSGDSSANGTPTSGEQTAYDCIKQGMSYGTINAVVVCVPPSSTNPVTTSTTSTSQTTSSSSPTPTTTTTTTTTTNSGPTTPVTSSTTTTSNGPAGTQTSTEQKEQPKSVFCEENPDSAICKQSSFGGGCGAFTCDGDAVQCAMAKEQHKRNCTMFDTDTAESTLGKQVAAGNDPQASNFPTAPGQVQTVNLATAIDTTNPFSAGCLQDKSFQIMTTTLVIPFSNICPFLETMGRIVLAFSLLMAARITFSGV